MSRPRNAPGIDRRPRIHVWSDNSWSIGPTGTRFPAPTPGRALDAALEKVAAPAVVIVEKEEFRVREH